MVAQKSKLNRLNAGDYAMYIFVGLFALFCMIPMLLAISVSFSDEASISRYGYRFIPSAWSTEAYSLIFNGSSSVMQGMLISILTTFVGTLGALVITASAAYTLSNRNVRYRNQLSFYFFIPMTFGAGLVPWYLMCNALGLRNNFGALIIPSLLFSPFNLFLVRNYMSGLPNELREAACIDGATDITIFVKIYLPLCKPVLATVALFYGLAYWNDWWNAIMLVEDKKLYPLQYLLLQLKSQIQMIKDMQRMTGGAAAGGRAPSESLKMATSLITIGPIVLLYPLLQKYFVKGLVVGSVKG
ncbi:MAG: carbohydrate ABC transporter permease [Eubacteriales bacterium]|nr:carbohydrate ABC transporter permease [Eubacteriales bacterium]